MHNKLQHTQIIACTAPPTPPLALIPMASVYIYKQFILAVNFAVDELSFVCTRVFDISY